MKCKEIAKNKSEKSNFYFLGGDVFETVDAEITAETQNSEEAALRTADKLLRELKPRPGQQMMSFQLLQGMLLMATKNKASIERALQDFLSLASMEQQGRENVGAILGMKIKSFIADHSESEFITESKKSKVSHLKKLLWHKTLLHNLTYCLNSEIQMLDYVLGYQKPLTTESVGALIF